MKALYKVVVTCVAIGIVGLSSCQSSNSYHITGMLPEGASDTVLLYVDRELIGTAIAENKKFSFHGTFEKPQIAAMHIAGEKKSHQVFLEAGKISATYNPSSRRFIFRGAKLNDIIARFYDENQKDFMRMEEIKEMYSLQESKEAKEKLRMEYLDLHGKVASLNKEYLLSQPTTLASLSLLVQAVGKLSDEELKQELDKLAQFSEYSLYQYLEKDYQGRIKMRNVSEGKKAPNFKGETPEGEMLEMSDLLKENKILIIDFWASWCPPCRAENPHTVAMYNKWHPKGLEILGVSLDKDKEAWIKAIKEDKLTWKHVSELNHWKSKLVELYAVNSVPTLLIVNSEGMIVARGLRGEKLRAKVEELLTAAE